MAVPNVGFTAKQLASESTNEDVFGDPALPPEFGHGNWTSERNMVSV